MRVAVIGGKLQGVEAVYLARKAGWKVLLIDKAEKVPAAGMCREFRQLDVTDRLLLEEALQDIQLIIPAMENQEALDAVTDCAKAMAIPFIFDNRAYAISSSKSRSNKLFTELGVPAPLPWPYCGYPVIAKPSEASGSEGVIKIRSQQEFNLHRALSRSRSQWIVEEYLEGPSYSIEVIGYKGTYNVLQITELQMDEVYDCKRVLAPVTLPQGLKEKFEAIALLLAKSLNLQGVMDVEVILNQGKLKVLEIDARLPSQTPTAVYKSSGINMLELLGKAFAEDQPLQELVIQEQSSVVYEHISVFPYRLEVSGEHIMAEAKKLFYIENFFGADEVITDYAPGSNHWVATLIISGRTPQEAWEKRCRVIKDIIRELGISSYVDLFPTPMAEGNYDMGSL